MGGCDYHEQRDNDYMIVHNGKIVDGIKRTHELRGKSKPDICLQANTNKADRKGCYQITIKHSKALYYAPAWSKEHQQAVASVERAKAELQRVKYLLASKLAE